MSYLYTCMYVCICTYTHNYIYIYIFIYLCICVARLFTHTGRPPTSKEKGNRETHAQANAFIYLCPNPYGLTIPRDKPSVYLSIAVLQAVAGPDALHDGAMILRATAISSSPW